MKTIYGLVLTAALAGMASTVSAASMSAVDAATLCRAQALSEYASGDRAPRVTFKGIYGGNTERKVRMQILPAEGRAFLAVCTVNGRSGGVVGLAPNPHAGTVALVASARD